MLEKAATLPADEVVVDLEDGVARGDKERARANLTRARARGTLGRHSWQFAGKIMKGR